jgi:hypothetical protein
LTNAVVTAIAAATMLAFLPFRSPLSLDGRLAKHILLPSRRSRIDEAPIPMDCFRPSSPVESRLPRDREDPCSFRTRLMDPVADPEGDMAFESTDKLDAGDLKFDDTQCISVGRSARNFKSVSGVATSRIEPANACDAADEPPLHPYSTLIGPEKYGQPRSSQHSLGSKVILTRAEGRQSWVAHKALSDPTPYRTSVVSENDDNINNHESDDDGMETMNMPFWNAPERQKRRSTIHAGDTIPDDMSIISDVSLIPTYSPSDALKQQRPQHRALIKRIIRAKARAARRTMRELKRSCRDAVGSVFLEPAAPRTAQCVAVGSAF